MTRSAEPVRPGTAFRVRSRSGKQQESKDVTREVVLSAAIMTHDARIDLATRFTGKHPDIPFQIVKDPLPGVPRGTLRTARLAWSSVPPGATHHLVVQDDIILGPDFLEKVLGAIQRLPDHAIALFTEWGSRTSHAARVASLVGANWVEAVDEYVPTQALVMPAQACLAFDEFVTHELGPEIEDDDALLAFIRASRIPAVVAVPNLVEHRDLPSVAGNESHGARRSVSWSRDTPASLLGPVLANMPILPYFSWATGRAYCLFRAAPPYGWKRIPARDLALGWAFDEEGLTATLDTATGLISGASVFDCISVDTVKRLLLTAVVLGLAAQDTSRGPRFSECRMTSEPSRH